MNVRFYIDLETGMPHILSHGLKKAKLRMFWRRPARTGLVETVRASHWAGLREAVTFGSSMCPIGSLARSSLSPHTS